MPKSPSAGSPNSEMNRFCGLMSRCSRPRSWAVCNAPEIFTPTSRTVATDSEPSRRCRSIIVPPLYSSITMHGCFVEVNALLNTVTMCGCWDTSPIARHSR